MQQLTILYLTKTLMVQGVKKGCIGNEWVNLFVIVLSLALRSSARLFVFLSTQPAFTCSKLTIETLEQGVKYDQG